MFDPRLQLLNVLIAVLQLSFFDLYLYLILTHLPLKAYPLRLCFCLF